MNKEEELIGRLQSGIKHGPNACIHRPSPESNPNEKVDRIEQLAQSVRKAKDMIKKEDNDNYEMVNHPQHYNEYDIEVIEMMKRIWGVEATILFCQMNAYKYRQRMGLKPGQSIDQDLAKERWYLNKAKELKIENKLQEF